MGIIVLEAVANNGHPSAAGGAVEGLISSNLPASSVRVWEVGARSVAGATSSVRGREPMAAGFRVDDHAESAAEDLRADSACRK